MRDADPAKSLGAQPAGGAARWLRRTSRWRGWIAPAVIPVGVLLTWELAAWLSQTRGGPSPWLVILPPPSRFVPLTLQLALDPAILEAATWTLGTTLLGYALGTLGAVAIGTLVGGLAASRRLLWPSLHFLRSLPVALYVPLALVLLPADARVSVALSSLVATLYGALPVAEAVRGYDVEKSWTLISRGYTLPERFFGFLLPEIIGALSLSASLCVTLAFAVVIVAEMLLPSLGGLGAALLSARESSQYAHLWGLTFLVGLVGYLFHQVVLAAWGWTAPWIESDN